MGHFKRSGFKYPWKWIDALYETENERLEIIENSWNAAYTPLIRWCAENTANTKSLAIIGKKKFSLDLAKKKYTKITAYKNYKIAVKDPLLDIVVISSSTSTHFAIAKYALQNHKHILVEKPLSLSLKEVKKLNKI